MIKRILVLLILTFFICGTGSAERINHQLSITVHKSDTEYTRSIDIYQNENDITVFSELFPTYFISAHHFPLISLNRSGEFTQIHSISEIRSALMNWSLTNQTSEGQGFYIGDSFELANSVLRGKCDLNSLMNLMREIFACSFSLTDFVIDDNGWEFEYKVFNAGEFFSLNGKKNNETVFTVSADFSENESFGLVFGYGDREKNYYWKSRASIQSGVLSEGRTEFYADDNRKGFRKAAQSGSVLEAEWKIKPSENGNIKMIQGQVSGNNGAAPISFLLTRAENEKLMMEGKIFFGKDENRYILFSLKNEPTEMNTESRKEISLNSILSDGMVHELLDEISRNILDFYIILAQIVPAEYLAPVLLYNN